VYAVPLMHLGHDEGVSTTACALGAGRTADVQGRVLVCFRVSRLDAIQAESPKDSPGEVVSVYGGAKSFSFAVSSINGAETAMQWKDDRGVMRTLLLWNGA
jgi:hypothetical protein